jgi:hypothetical protein
MKSNSDWTSKSMAGHRPQWTLAEKGILIKLIEHALKVGATKKTNLLLSSGSKGLLWSCTTLRVH